MNNIKLINIKDVIEENAKLRIENDMLRKHVYDSKSWLSLREGIIIPELLRGGIPKHLAGYVTTAIGNIVKEYLDVSRLVEINAINYEKAKNITLDIVQVLGKYEHEKSINLNKRKNRGF
ncbi:DNA replication initiation control protein YabA [Clostridium sardiniense]|uniref:DNA replication initiation control protein YabA n=1 Tax=Clostridium sardiniense TaxID=29369 RepID=A0ABS7L1B5_CLOSR|nr:DNA replication initiation control protein YabA [Clostridium sardiniense]MBY0756542.1 DNA replication initiation control protein YabA [Clostridium sardiniense]MDQ0460291.1 hypothetical protein [Clostridium sardiniense]